MGLFGFIVLVFQLIIKPWRLNKKLKQEIKTTNVTLSEFRKKYEKKCGVANRYGEIIREICIKVNSAYKADVLDKEKLYAIIVLCDTSIDLVERNEANFKGE